MTVAEHTEEPVEPQAANLIKVSRYAEPAGSGGSASFLGICSDGIARIVKAQGNPQKSIVLVNELVVGRLVGYLGSPSPDGTILEVPEHVLEDARRDIPQLAGAIAGVGFGCHWYDVQYNPGVDICSAATNRERLIDIVAIGIWTRDSDMKGDHLLHRILPDGSIVVMGFDHGHCFGPPDWDESIADKADQRYFPAVTNIHAVIQPQDVGSCIDRLNAITEAQVTAAVTDVPPEWGVDQDKLSALRRYLIASRATVVAELRSKFIGNPGAAP